MVASLTPWERRDGMPSMTAGKYQSECSENLSNNGISYHFFKIWDFFYHAWMFFDGLIDSFVSNFVCRLLNHILCKIS